MILECLHSINYFQRTILRQLSASKFTYELALLFTVSHCQLRDSFVILAQLVVSCQHLFLKLFETFSASVAPLSLTSVCGFLLFLLLFFVVLFSTTLLSYQSAFTLTTLFLTFFYFCNLRHYLQFLPLLFVHF